MSIRLTREKEVRSPIEITYVDAFSGDGIQKATFSDRHFLGVLYGVRKTNMMK